MKSGIYIAIFIAVVAVIGGLIWYNAQDVNNITSETVTIDKQQIDDNAKENVDVVAVGQKDINILLDDDFEADAMDVTTEVDLLLLDDVDLFADEEGNVSF